MNPAGLHDYEAYFSFSTREAVVLVVFVLVWLLLQLTGKGPKMQSMRDFVNLINTRGGNILLLAAFGWYFFNVSMRLFYHTIALMAAKQLDTQNAVALMALQFCTTSAFGGAFGAMLKTMTGSDGQSRTTDILADPDTRVVTTMSSVKTGPIASEDSFISEAEVVEENAPESSEPKWKGSIPPPTP